jgi:hypothetical protein
LACGVPGARARRRCRSCWGCTHSRRLLGKASLYDDVRADVRCGATGRRRGWKPAVASWRDTRLSAVSCDKGTTGPALCGVFSSRRHHRLDGLRYTHRHPIPCADPYFCPASLRGFFVRTFRQYFDVTRYGGATPIAPVYDTDFPRLAPRPTTAGHFLGDPYAIAARPASVSSSTTPLLSLVLRACLVAARSRARSAPAPLVGRT